MQTRKDTTASAAKGIGETDWYFGELLADLKPQKNSQLPTNGDAIKHYLFLKRTTRIYDEPSKVITDVVAKVNVFWDLAGISTLNHPASKPKRTLATLIKKFAQLKKHKNTPNVYETECRNFNVLCAELLDMAHPQAEHNIQCCRYRTPEKKVEDLEFLQDQRTTRLKCMGTVDKNFSNQVQNKEKRLQAVEDLKHRQSSSVAGTATLVDSENESSSSDSSSDDYTPPSPLKKLKKSASTSQAELNLLKSPEYHLIADRFKLTHRARTSLAGVAQV